MFPRLVVDRWSDGGNRRSFVALTADGEVLGYCKAVDNVVHPGSRGLLMEVRPDLAARETSVRDALLQAQVSASATPLHLKIHAHQKAEIALAARHGGVAIQLTPPWRYVVDDQFRAWAAAHPGPVEQISDSDREQVRELEADHYIAQHASWSPAAPRAVILDYFAETHERGSDVAWDPGRSVVIRRAGHITAAALLWPVPTDSAWDGREVSLLSRPYESPRALADKSACLASIVQSAADDDVLLIDSHLTERTERALARDLPRTTPTIGTDSWMAIVAIPVQGAASLQPIVPDLIPDHAEWVRKLR